MRATHQKKLCSGWHICGHRDNPRASGQPGRSLEICEEENRAPTPSSNRPVRDGCGLGPCRETRGQSSVRVGEGLRAHDQALPGQHAEGWRPHPGPPCQGNTAGSDRKESGPADRDLRANPKSDSREARHGDIRGADQGREGPGGTGHGGKGAEK